MTPYQIESCLYMYLITAALMLFLMPILTEYRMAKPVQHNLLWYITIAVLWPLAAISVTLLVLAQTLELTINGFWGIVRSAVGG